MLPLQSLYLSISLSFLFFHFFSHKSVRCHNLSVIKIMRVRRDLSLLSLSLSHSLSISCPLSLPLLVHSTRSHNLSGKHELKWGDDIYIYIYIYKRERERERRVLLSLSPFFSDTISRWKINRGRWWYISSTFFLSLFLSIHHSASLSLSLSSLSSKKEWEPILINIHTSYVLRAIIRCYLFLNCLHFNADRTKQTSWGISVCVDKSNIFITAFYSTGSWLKKLSLNLKIIITFFFKDAF